MILPANYQPTKPMQPSKESLHAPASAVAAKRATILRDPLAIAFVRSDQLDVVGCKQVGVQWVAIVGGIADQSFREFVEEALPESFFDELAFVRRSALDTNGERKTVISGDGNDLGAFAALGRTNREPPFLAPEKEASMNPSANGNWPRACNSAASNSGPRSERLRAGNQGWNPR